MIKVSAFYPNEEDKTFDKEYFIGIYLPMAEKTWGTVLKKKEIDFGLSGQGSGVPPPYRVITHFYFESIESLQTVLGTPKHQELAQMTAKFTNITPVIQVSAVVSAQMSEDSVENKPSQTAEWVALCRALSYRDERVAIKGPDSLAHLFISENSKKMIESSDSVKRGIAFTAPIFGTLVARTAYFDHLFNEAIKNDKQQIVFIGAGYDTRAYRFSEKLNGTKIYEMDINSTQERKLTILSQAQIDIPPQVKYVNINFNNERILDVLLKHDYNPSKPTLFVWEGVTCYLTETVFYDTLNELQSFAQKGSSIGFDYQISKRESMALGEPFRFWVRPEDLTEKLSSSGFKILDHITPQEMEVRYLSLEDGTIAEIPLSMYHFIHIAV